MTTVLSTKGQIVLPKQARIRLQLGPGTRLVCRIEGQSIVLTPEKTSAVQPMQVRDPRTGLVVTQSPEHFQVTNEDIRSVLQDFP